MAPLRRLQASQHRHQAGPLPSPHMDDLSARLSGKKVFSKLDLRKGYYQVPVSPKDIKKTAVITPFGLYEFL